MELSGPSMADGPGGKFMSPDLMADGPANTTFWDKHNDGRRSEVWPDVLGTIDGAPRDMDPEQVHDESGLVALTSSSSDGARRRNQRQDACASHETPKKARIFWPDKTASSRSS